MWTRITNCHCGEDNCGYPAELYVCIADSRNERVPILIKERYGSWHSIPLIQQDLGIALLFLLAIPPD